ncbi:MAG: ABC transporter permease [Gemmataceae bacterium]|nr:ABC transporter permease [Gemmataceae bacterium]
MLSHVTAVWKFRHFLLALVRLDLRLRYRRSVLGIGWSLLNPIAMTIVFTVVFSGILGADAKKYAPFLLVGMAIWAFLRESAVAGSRALIANESYIRQSPLPYALYPLRTVLGQAIHFAIALAVGVALVVFLNGHLGNPEHGTGPLEVIGLIAPGLVLILIAAWAVATVFAFVNVYFQDTQHLLEVGSQILFFLTPIIYERSKLDGKDLGWVVDANPANLFMDLIRAPILHGEPPTLQLYLTAAGVTAGLVGLAAGTTAWLQKKVIFHL